MVQRDGGGGDSQGDTGREERNLDFHTGTRRVSTHLCSIPDTWWKALRGEFSADGINPTPFLQRPSANPLDWHTSPPPVGEGLANDASLSEIFLSLCMLSVYIYLFWIITARFFNLNLVDKYF